VSGTFEEIFERIKAVTGVKNQTQLAKLLGLRTATVSEAKNRDNVPAEWILRVSVSHNINPAWLLTGQGPQKIGTAYDQQPPAAAVTGQHDPAYGKETQAVDTKDLAERMKSVVEHGGQFSAAVVNTINVAYKGMHDDNTLQRGVSDLRGVLPAKAMSKYHHRLIEYIRQLNDDDITNVYMQIASSSDFAAWYAKHFQGGKQQRPEARETKEEATK